LVFEAFQRRLDLLDLVRSRAALREDLSSTASGETSGEACPPVAGVSPGKAPGESAGGDTELSDAVAVPPYALQLVQGVSARQAEISEWLDTYSQGWPQSRMPAVDRAILYVGAYEVVFEDDVPDPVVLKWAADLAAKLSTDKSADFVSGLLGRLSRIKSTLL
jgi:N utilization substance protein B